MAMRMRARTRLAAATHPGPALLDMLALSQTARLFEHSAQMVPIHGLGLGGASARGVVGQLDVEWVHFHLEHLDALGGLLVQAPPLPDEPLVHRRHDLRGMAPDRAFA